MKKRTLNEEVGGIRSMMLGLQKPITEAADAERYQK